MEYKKCKIKVHLWENATKKVDFGITELIIDNKDCMYFNCNRCKSNMKKRIKCFLNYFGSFHFEIIKQEKDDGNK